ncbi:flagellar biosynthesis protein FliQ [Sedimentibacter sp. B4]|uniref:flagellar biosynthesis protein FliQ n=1 Tax=Sedimentibacter sp. B4 TaxID=304766 RepID=UPI0002D80F18|nr:flagellar biosynthesis protein FliQ [Sedimentibacter sp. B4]
MNISFAMEIMQSAAMAAIKIAAPILLLSLTIGLLIAVFQAATQIHEQTLTFVPKLLVTVLVLIMLGPWMMEVMSDFIFHIFDLMLTVY